MKFTDEELSRILSAHEGDVVRQGGSDFQNYCCVFQAAAPGTSVQGAYHLAACKGMRGLVQKFDSEYFYRWTTDRLLRWLESQGVA